jgi:hypothetical protein
MSSVERLPPDGNICLIDADSLLYYEMDKPLNTYTSMQAQPKAAINV